MSQDFSPPVGEWYYPSDEIVQNSHIPDYDTVYNEAMQDPEAFWAKRASTLEWYKPWDKVLDTSNAPFNKKRLVITINSASKRAKCSARRCSSKPPAVK